LRTRAAARVAQKDARSVSLTRGRDAASARGLRPGANREQQGAADAFDRAQALLDRHGISRRAIEQAVQAMAAG